MRPPDVALHTRQSHRTALGESIHSHSFSLLRPSARSVYASISASAAASVVNVGASKTRSPSAERAASGPPASGLPVAVSNHVTDGAAGSESPSSVVAQAAIEFSSALRFCAAHVWFLL